MNIWEQTTALLKKPFQRHSLLHHPVRRILFGLLVLQVLTASALVVIAKFGKREKHDASFPHIPLEEVQVGANQLQLYSYGRDLFDAMLEAIDDARESIFLETYIWKDDALGREFQEHLARKAEEGWRSMSSSTTLATSSSPKRLNPHFIQLFMCWYIAPCAISGICWIHVATHWITASC